jgi:ElaB/YqjD/DUF883 family membrane-anchored ribosome-binding protein
MTDNLREKANARYAEAREKVGEAYVKGRASADAAVATSKAKAVKAATVTKANAKKAAKTTVDSVEKNPIVALLGGLAVGAIAAALLPRTKREDDLVGSVGKTVRGRASTAAKAARDTAKEQLDSLGVNADAAKGTIRDIANKIGAAASSATSAAADAVRKR